MGLQAETRVHTLTAAQLPAAPVPVSDEQVNTAWSVHTVGFLSCRKGWSSDTCSHTDEPGKHC